MKRLNLQGIMLFFVSLLFLTSCLGEGPQVQPGRTCVVVRFDMKSGKNLLDVSETESFYSNQFDYASEGNCFFVSYEIDYDKEENSAANIEANGYILVDVYHKPEIDRWNVSAVLTDTSQVLMDEVVLNYAIMNGEFVYIKGIFFVNSALIMPADQQMYWNLSYDYDNMMSEEQGFRYYNVYLRASIRVASTKSKDGYIITNAFDMKNYLENVANKEKESGGTSFRIRFHYASEISEDGQIKWSSQDSNEIRIINIVPE